MVLTGVLAVIGMLRVAAPGPAPAQVIAPVAPTPAPTCDPSLWQHVYAGNFARPQDRLRLITPCVTVTGYIDPQFPPSREPDGDWHIHLKLDPPYRNMLNQANYDDQHGDVVVETVCSNRVTQADVLREGVCAGFRQHLYEPDMLGKHVQVTGAFVIDMSHGWRELHPITSLVVIE